MALKFDFTWYAVTKTALYKEGVQDLEARARLIAQAAASRAAQDAKDALNWLQERVASKVDPLEARVAQLEALVAQLRAPQRERGARASQTRRGAGRRKPKPE